MRTCLKNSMMFLDAWLPFATAWAEPEIYQFDTQHTYPNFEVGHLGYSVRHGWFEKTEGRVSIDRAAGTGEMQVDIGAASVNTGLAVRDNFVRSDNFGFLDVKNYPVISFHSTKFEFEGQDLKRVLGDLTIKGKTKPVVLEMVSMHCGEHPMKKVPMCGGEARAVIQKKDFGEFGGGMLSDDIRLTLEFEAYKQ